MNLERNHKRAGFSLVELMVGAVIFLFVSAGAYFLFSSTTKKATEVQQSTKLTRGMTQFFERFRFQVENTIQLPRALGTVLQLERREACWETDNQERYIGWGLIPYPGHTRPFMDSGQNTFHPIYPPDMDVDDADRSNDAVRMVYIPDSTVVHYLAMPGGAPSPTNNSNPILVDGPANDIAVGDFVVIADSLRQELIRVTDIAYIGGQASLSHGSQSSWNANWTGSAANYNFGATNILNLGRPIIYKVNVVTYALDRETHTLMMNSHRGDDGFVPPNTWGTPGVSATWEAVAPNISRFQVIYTRMDGAQTRQPQPGLPGETYESCSSDNPPANCGCQNELGNPGIKNIQISIVFADQNGNPGEEMTTETFNPTLLKKGVPLVGADHLGCNTNETLYDTLEDGSPHEECINNKYCVCSPRGTNSPGSGSPPTGEPGYGGGQG